MRMRNNYRLRVWLAGICLLFSQNILAINVVDVATGGITPAMLASVLQGGGVTISNLTVTHVAGCNSNAGVGIFTQGTSPTGPGPVLAVPTGVIISNGAFNASVNPLNSANNRADSTNLLCSGTASDTDMRSLEPATVNGEYAAIEFDVTPQYATLAIPFQFGSDEFPEYVCTAFNDVVGIFVSGMGINGPYSGSLKAENFAKTASGDLSSINWVNTGVVGQYGNITSCGSLLNAPYYTDNSNGNPLGGNTTVATTNTNLQVDGYTNTLYKPISVVPGQTYHVKIAVADAGDRIYDSSAFIQPIFSSGTFSGFDFGDAPNSYQTLTSNGGASHGINGAIYMGNNAPDTEVTGSPSINADADDISGIDDEDGISSFPLLTTSASSYSVTVKVTNNTGKNARLVGWIDFNKNGRFDATEGASLFVPSGMNGTNVTLNWTGLTGLVAGKTYARFRLSTDNNLSTLLPGSTLSDGEVEDYPVTIYGVKFTKYTSTNPTCNDTLTTLTVAPGSSIYYCYTVTNPNTIPFTINPGNTSDDHGHNLSALEQNYSPGASKTVIIGPILAGSSQLPDGGTTVNTAQVIATFGSNNTTHIASATVTVIKNPPASGIKQLYLDTLNGTPELTRVVPQNNTRSSNINAGQSMSINQLIHFQLPFVISSGSTVNIKLWLRNRGGSGNRTAQVTLYHGQTGTLIGSASQTWTGRQYLSFPVSITGAQTFAKGDFIRLVIKNISSNGRDIRIESIKNGNISQLQIQTTTVINVDSIKVYSTAWPATTSFPSYKPGSTVFIRASVSDPFGYADINSATMTLTDSAAGLVLNNVSMTSVATPSGSSRVYEYAYTIPAAPQGIWTIKVKANEGTEGKISHTAQATMVVGLPAITISKNTAVLSDPVNTSKPKSIPGSIIEYTVNIKNSGFGYVDANSIVITDPVPAGTTFYFGNPLKPVTFIDGATPSGISGINISSLASTTDDIDFSNDGGTTFITPQVDSNGFDITAPPINFIRINPKGIFNGSDGINQPSMNIKFRVRVN